MQTFSRNNPWNAAYYRQSSSHKESYNRLNNKMHNNEILQNKLLSPKPYHIRRSLSDWTIELLNTLRDMNDKENNYYCMGKLTEIFNHAVLVFIGLGKYAYARELCYTQIQKLTHWSNKTNISCLLKYVFQPWVYLIQINRLDDKISDAVYQLNALNFTNLSEINIGENKLLMQSLYQSLHQDPLLLKSIITQCMIERILLYFESKQYSELIIFIEKNNIPRTQEHMIMIQEAQAIAYANSGKIHEAWNVLRKKSYPYSQQDPVLILRECEMKLSLKDAKDISNKLQLLYEACLFWIDSNNLTLNHISMVLHTASLMKLANMTKESIKLVYCCLEASIKMSDEISKAESLILLYDFVADLEGKKIIEDLMITHYFNTQYAVARKQMLCCFKDLQYVEDKYHHDAMIPLFEELLAFDLY